MATTENTDESTSEDTPASAAYFHASAMVNQNMNPSTDSNDFNPNSKPIIKSSQRTSPGRQKWLKAVEKLRTVKLDPWNNFDLQNCPTKEAIRHRYNSLTKKWVQDKITAKIEPLPFDHGAMRECFRLKKLPTQGSHKNNWYYASNYVAKSYINPVNSTVYFEDVKLQMDTKLWAEEYNRNNPPKKIDMFQLSVLQIELSDGSSQFYHVERFMEGTYCKYNSNSGFVEDTKCRNTPQVFSHFTFEKSGHRLLIVDIQGVGDLYTDPQVHTADGQGYGDGNLGPRGMALFFHSHRCNSLCHWLGLTQFDLQSTEKSDHQGSLSRIGTTSRQDQPSPVSPALATPLIHHLMSLSPVRQRGESLSESRDRMLSIDSGCLSESGGDNIAVYIEELHQQSNSSTNSLLFDASQCIWAAYQNELIQEDGRAASGPVESSIPDLMSSDISSLALSQHGGGCCESICGVSGDVVTSRSDGGVNLTESPAMRPSNLWQRQARERNISECSELEAPEEDYCTFHALMHDHHKPTCANHSKNLDQEIGQSVLAQIHHELALLHYEGRFSRDLEGFDWSSILYHEKLAAQLGHLESILSMAAYCFQSPKEHLLRDCPIKPDHRDIETGVDYLTRAADSGHLGSMVELALYLDRTASAGESSTSQMKEALMWYLQALDYWSQEEESPDSLPQFPLKQYEVMARVADIYAEGVGGVGRDVTRANEFYNQAAEVAMNLQKGRQATKYFELAEQVLDSA